MQQILEMCTVDSNTVQTFCYEHSDCCSCISLNFITNSIFLRSKMDFHVFFMPIFSFVECIYSIGHKGLLYNFLVSLCFKPLHQTISICTTYVFSSESHRQSVIRGTQKNILQLVYKTKTLLILNENEKNTNYKFC